MPGSVEPAGPLGLSAMRRALLAHADALAVPVSLDVVCRLAALRWGGAAVAVSVPISGAGAPPFQTVAAAALARSGEELQATIGEGPSLEVLAGAGAIRVADLAVTELSVRWPLFTPAAVLAGIRSVAVVPMRVGAARFGAFVVYQPLPGGLGQDEAVEAFALATIALDLLLDYLGPDQPVAIAADEARWADLGDHRPEIHQATGMLSVQLQVDLPTALLWLRGRAFAENRLLSDLAADVVSRVVRFDVEEPSAGERDGDRDDVG